MAFEVHALSPDGSSTPIDPRTYAFRSGDRFVVYYRPSMPGRVDIVNIAPQGQQNLIDSVNVPGGQLMTLGPYEFTGSTGDESLSLVLTPCSSSAIMAATRDIVKANAATAGGAPGLALQSCDMAATRGVRPHTRDIRKMQMDAGTSYALDPVTQQEVATGQYDARQVTISFHHQ
jgi:hypothetical protein